MSISKTATAATGIFLAAALYSPSLTAQSQSPCPIDGTAIIAELQKEYGEYVEAIGVNSHGNFVQWLANPETGTWSVVVFMPNGVGCLTAHGTHWVRPGDRT